MKTENPQAFPCVDSSYLQEGMELRDYFAAKAMQGFISTMNPTSSLGGAEDYTAKESYKIADAMLKARKTEDQ
jgi:hypothetical protein